MENASKALIIAGAILIAILIISFGVMIIGGVSDKMKPDMTEAEIAQFNQKFEAYEGTAVRGSNVKQLIKTTYQHNIQNKDDVSKQVSISGVANASVTKGDGKSTSGIEQDYSGIQSGKTYEVKCSYDDAGGGLVTSITLKLNTTTTTPTPTPTP